MSQRMQADVLYLDPAEARPGIAVLVKQGFDVEPLVDWIDECGPTVFYRIRINSTLDESAFFDWVQSLVDPFDGDTIEAGLADPPPQLA
jgi:hypothetical protein